MKAYKINQIKNKQVLGRVAASACGDDKPLPLFWAASGLNLKVKSNEVWILISSDYSDQAIWVAVEVNGYQTNRFIAPKEKTWICISKGMSETNENLIAVYKDTQPMPGDGKHSLLIHEIGLSDTGSFCEGAECGINIEFIGDSITSGEGLAGNPLEMDWISQWMCASKTYAVQVAKNFNANFSTISQCGWGICWGWDGNENSVIPKYYNQVCGLLDSDCQKSLGADETYDFPYENDFVVVNLGTNDNGAFSQPAWVDENGVAHVHKTDENGNASPEDFSAICNGVVAFLKNIREKNHKAKIIWCWGMIKLKTAPVCIAEGISRYKKETGDTEVYSLELDAMEDVEKTLEDKGSRGHPGPKTHSLAASKLSDFIKSLM